MNQLPYLNSKISLISRSGFHYEGTLYSINTEKSTVALKDGIFFVFIIVKILDSNGEVIPNCKVYEFIVFRGNDIESLTVIKVFTLYYKIR
jgi:protein LSM14